MHNEQFSLAIGGLSSHTSGTLFAFCTHEVRLDRQCITNKLMLHLSMPIANRTLVHHALVSLSNLQKVVLSLVWNHCGSRNLMVLYGLNLGRIKLLIYIANLSVV
jgi:hypothetical protein